MATRLGLVAQLVREGAVGVVAVGWGGGGLGVGLVLVGSSVGTGTGKVHSELHGRTTSAPQARRLSGLRIVEFSQPQAVSHDVANQANRAPSASRPACDDSEGGLSGPGLGGMEVASASNP